ncbi:hypothetical protein BKA61DRAFT_654308 [Leptodontidium sp. MPI-SDFR-AT-0119]|nr:hypothetical protein BKA61DRAFT_654308 [Leptodontidium sp. MPI-SDFR-AT-0119]
MSLNPVRHGADEVWISNTSSDFFIFKKVSIERLSHIDVHGIWSWRDLEGSYHKLFEQFPRAFEVKNGKHQWWNHEPGNEFLAANPVDIPGFSMLIKESEREFGFDNGGRRWPYNTNDGAFHFSYRNDHEHWKIDHKTPPPGNSSNLFSRLPNEPYLSVLQQVVFANFSFLVGGFNDC